LTRPPSIVRFERLLIVSILLGPLNLGLIGKHLVNIEALAALAPDRPVSLIAVALGIALSLLLCLLASRRRSRIAAWLSGLWIVFTVGAFLLTWLTGGYYWNLAFGLSLLMLILKISALLELVRPESRRWFAGQGEVDPEVFR
jgi:hypothetical protein